MHLYRLVEKSYPQILHYMFQKAHWLLIKIQSHGVVQEPTMRGNLLNR